MSSLKNEAEESPTCVRLRHSVASSSSDRTRSREDYGGGGSMFSMGERSRSPRVTAHLKSFLSVA